MLSFRLVLVTIAAGLCLWSLFSLLDNLSEPGLLRSEKAAVVKGCDQLNNEETQRLCPPLLCQKALIDSKAIEPRTDSRVVTDRSSDSERLITVTLGAASDASARAEFVCVMQRDKVLLARRAAAEEIEAAIQADGAWFALLSATIAP